MNREIKFRAWNEGQIIYPTLNGHGQLTSGEILNRFETIMQYTGLKDKNGKDIYEGDICKANSVDFGDEVMAVEFKNGSFVFDYHGWALSEWKTCNIEVIGNIYENPRTIN